LKNKANCSLIGENDAGIFEEIGWFGKS